MVDFGNAIKKPFSDILTLVIGAILAAIPIVNLLVGGYTIKVAEDTIKGKKELRKWALKDIPDYIVKVILTIVVGLVYMIIPVILLVVGIGGAILTALPQLASMMSGGTATSTQFIEMITTSLIAGAPLIIAGVILAIIAAILLPMAIMKWLKTGKYGSAFNIVAVVKNVLTGKYWAVLIVGGIYTLVIMAILGIIGGLFLIVPVAGWIIGAVIIGAGTFITDVTMYTLLAQTVD